MTLTALGAVFMPYDWMNLIHQRLGVGELPQIPIVGYLTCSVSALYALHGALLIFLSRDIARCLPVVRFLGVAGVVMGVLLFGLDRAVGMPLPWAKREGPFVVAVSVAILVLAWRVKAHGQAAEPPVATRSVYRWKAELAPRPHGHRLAQDEYDANAIVRHLRSGCGGRRG